ncbi:MAG: glycosyltransferase family 1 protein [Cyanophyceae cyanobacterium]
MKTNADRPVMRPVRPLALTPLIAPPSFATPRSRRPERQAIALISVHGDPAADIGKEEAGGQNVYVREVGEALARLGWQVDLFTRRTDPNAPAIVEHGDHCRTIRLEAGPVAFVPRDELFDHLPEFVEAFDRFQNAEGNRYPLIHTNYWLSAWVGLRLKERHGVQLVHTYHSLGVVKYGAIAQLPPIATTRLEVEREILERADRVVATSPQEKEHMETLVSALGRIDTIPCGTDVNRFSTGLSRRAARQVLGMGGDRPVVLYVGRFDPRKGIETLVRAFGRLRDRDPQLADAQLVLVGGWDDQGSDGRERRRIGDILQELALETSVTFAGRVGHDRLPLYYAAANVCVVPSHYEPFGLVAIEAMGCGTPVVASNVGGLKFTVVPEETGLLVPPQDVEGFAMAIGRILKDPAWAQQLEARASDRVQQTFSWSGVSGHLSDLYRRLLAATITPTTPADLNAVRARTVKTAKVS